MGSNVWRGFVDFFKLWITNRIIKWCNHSGIHLAILQNIKDRITILPSNHNPSYTAKNIENICPFKNVYLSIYNSSVYNSQKWNYPNCPSAEKLIN